MFEAVHGSAPDIAGKDLANPSGVLNGGIMMLNYLKRKIFFSKILSLFFCKFFFCRIRNCINRS